MNIMNLAVVLSLAVLAWAEDQLLMAILITRHGARYGLHKDFWHEPFPWLSGELTNTGKRQHFLLGTEMQSRYMEALGITDPTREVFVRSTDFNRTLDSALANIMGLYYNASSLDLQ